MTRLNIDQLAVESFSVSYEMEDGADSTSTLAPTYYGCSCGCGTAVDCPSDGPNCTLDCVEPSRATNWQACCG